MLANYVIRDEFSFKIKKRCYGVQIIEGKGILGIKWLKIRDKWIY